MATSYGVCEDTYRLTCSLLSPLRARNWTRLFVFHIFHYTPSQWGNYHHSMFHNPTAAVNLFHVGKQYLTFCKAEAAVTHNLIGRKSFPTSNTLTHVTLFPFKTSYAQVTNATVRQSTANERYVKRQVSVIRVYTCSERHLTFRRNIDTRRQWSVRNIG